jgi:hypothetical protein
MAELTLEQKRAVAMASARARAAQTTQNPPALTAPRFMEQRAQNTEAQRQEYTQAEGERLRQERYARGEYGQRFITPEERRARAGAPAATTGDQAFRENVGAAVGGVSGLVSGGSWDFHFGGSAVGAAMSGCRLPTRASSRTRSVVDLTLRMIK